MRCKSMATPAGMLKLGLIPVLTLLASSAFAHHPMGGQVPATFVHGLLSGVGHPIIGLDHFAFLIAVGLVAALHRKPYVLPFAFLAAMVAGVLIHLGSLDLPAVEITVAASVVLLGVLAIRAKALPWAGFAALIAIAGLFHGHAFGEAVVGAEATPLLAYLAGLLAIQYAICAGVIWVVRNAVDTTDTAYHGPAVLARVAGGVACGIGVAFLAQNLTVV